MASGAASAAAAAVGAADAATPPTSSPLPAAVSTYPCPLCGHTAEIAPGSTDDADAVQQTSGALSAAMERWAKERSRATHTVHHPTPCAPSHGAHHS